MQGELAVGTTVAGGIEGGFFGAVRLGRVSQALVPAAWFLGCARAEQSPRRNFRAHLRPLARCWSIAHKPALDIRFLACIGQSE